MSVAEPINATAGGLNQGCWKRKGSEEDEENIERNAKKARYPYYVILESESPQPTSSDEDDESIHSIQAQETEYVQDTSDTSTHTWVSSSNNGEVVHVEYEVASTSEDDNPFIDDLSSTDSEDLIRVGVIAAAIYDSDVDLADNSDDSRSSRDSEISRADYWTCMQCNTSNNNPLFRLCEKCYRLRKNFFPPRPKGKKKRRKLSKSKDDQVQIPESHELMAQDSGLGSCQGSQPLLTFPFSRKEKERTSNSARNEEQPSSSSLSQESTDTVEAGSLTSQTSTISLSQSSELSLTQPSMSLTSQSSIEAPQIGTTSLSQSSETSLSEPNTGAMSQPICEEQSSVASKTGSNSKEKPNESNELRSCSQESVLSAATTLSVASGDFNQSECSENGELIDRILKLAKKSQLPTDSGSGLCIACTVVPKNGVFVHGKSSHICCCYRCAKKFWKMRPYCPVCNRRVTNVIRAYYA